MSPYLIATDLDGTLLGADHALAELTIETLRTLNARGHYIVLASGRHYRDILVFRDQLGIDVFIISTNGAYTHAPDDRVLDACHLPAEVARTLIRLPRPEGIRLNLYSADEWLIDAPAPTLLALHAHTGFAYRVADLHALSGDDIGKVLYIGDAGELKALEQRAQDRAGSRLHLTYSLDNSLEIMAAGVTKGRALNALLAQLGIPAERCLAFGDNRNDIEMLALAGEAHAMANAHPALMDAVPGAMRIGSHDRAAVARHLRERFAL
ncbi:HAD family hydrolase [Halomonas almeriensis]|uniref:HAD family hydrolase n=1 Tax=Halomonas almeriensis TaxID=308163 RepID=UPI0025B56299|nr:HAD family hydrolase [Halomonas almeriensis]MDN3552281.1 HAD family hydrolase [Halomonas almeriensis]